MEIDASNSDVVDSILSFFFQFYKKKQYFFHAVRASAHRHIQPSLLLLSSSCHRVRNNAVRLSYQSHKSDFFFSYSRQGGDSGPCMRIDFGYRRRGAAVSSTRPYYRTTWPLRSAAASMFFLCADGTDLVTPEHGGRTVARELVSAQAGTKHGRRVRSTRRWWLEMIGDYRGNGRSRLTSAYNSVERGGKCAQKCACRATTCLLQRNTNISHNRRRHRTAKSQVS